MPQRIHETAVLPAIDAEAAKSGRLLIEIISPGWGSSGYYSAKVLENAVAEKVWAKGTHVYLDHPTESETYSRPARTVKDLVAKLTEDAHLDEQGRVVAQIQVFKPYRPLLTDPDFAEAVGMSIRAAAEARMGEAEGRKGQIVTRLIPDRLNSVDVVTHAGRGGRILAVLESLRTPTDSEADATEAAVSDPTASSPAVLDAPSTSQPRELTTPRTAGEPAHRAGRNVPDTSTSAPALERRDRAADLRGAGWSNKRIARELGVHPSTVGRWFARAHLPDTSTPEMTDGEEATR